MEKEVRDDARSTPRIHGSTCPLPTSWILPHDDRSNRNTTIFRPPPCICVNISKIMHDALHVRQVRVAQTSVVSAESLSRP